MSKFLHQAKIVQWLMTWPNILFIPCYKNARYCKSVLHHFNSHSSTSTIHVLTRQFTCCLCRGFRLLIQWFRVITFNDSWSFIPMNGAMGWYAVWVIVAFCHTPLNMNIDENVQPKKVTKYTCSFENLVEYIIKYMQ